MENIKMNGRDVKEEIGDMEPKIEDYENSVRYGNPGEMIGLGASKRKFSWNGNGFCLG